ncbi:MAG: hypothetical protein ACOZF0_14185 [Thermodesulfobacteriota bacterium]
MSDIIKRWQLAAEDIGFIIVTPYRLKLPSGDQIFAELLVKDFGPPNGMLIVNKFDSVKLFTNEIINMGYGVSIIDNSYGQEPYDRQSFIEMLKDWGWNRDAEESPF